MATSEGGGGRYHSYDYGGRWRQELHGALHGKVHGVVVQVLEAGAVATATAAGGGAGGLPIATAGGGVGGREVDYLLAQLGYPGIK